MSDWKKKERGTPLAIRLTFWLGSTAGRTPTIWLANLVAFYFTLFSPKARQAIGALRERLGISSGFWKAYRQVRRFAHCTVDALFLLRGELNRFEVTRDGHEYLDKLKREKTGAVLLGAHLGSFYAMRAAGTDEALPIYPLVYTKHARQINGALEELAPDSTVRLIEIQDDQVAFMLRVRELLQEGALVAILGDRVPQSGQVVEVDFLGRRAKLPAGPYIIANALKCPVYFTVGLYHPPNRYELHCEPFAERIVLKRGARLESAAQYAQAYADRVAHYVRETPENWFNFYDFWGSGEGQNETETGENDGSPR